MKQKERARRPGAASKRWLTPFFDPKPKSTTHLSRNFVLTDSAGTAAPVSIFFRKVAGADQLNH